MDQKGQRILPRNTPEMKKTTRKYLIRVGLGFSGGGGKVLGVCSGIMAGREENELELQLSRQLSYRNGPVGR